VLFLEQGVRNGLNHPQTNSYNGSNGIAKAKKMEGKS